MDTQAALQTLELSRPFTKTELKKAYRDALLVWHPDRFPDGSELKAKAEAKTYKITEAYSLLSKHHEDSISSNVASADKQPTASNNQPKGSPANIRRKPPTTPPIRKPSSVDHSRQETQRASIRQPLRVGVFNKIEATLNSPKALRIYSLAAWITVTPFVLLLIISFAVKSLGDKDNSRQDASKPHYS